MPSDGPRWLSGSVLIFAVLLIRAFLTICEVSITEMPDNRVRALAGKNLRERALKSLHSKPTRLITTFAVNQVLCGVVVAYLAAVTFHPIIEDAMFKVFPSMVGSNVISVVAFLILTLFSTIMMVSLTENLPRKLIGHNPERLALFCALPAKLAWTISLPLTACCNVLSTLLLRLFGRHTDNHQDVVTEEEILMMVDAGSETGVIEVVQKEMISNIFEFGDLEVSDIMTHRTDMIAVDLSAKVSQVVYLAISSGKSRIPVYNSDIDRIAGIVNVKDLLCLVGCEQTDDFSLRDFLREAMFVPATSNCQEVFQRMTATKSQMAIAVDEYGGTAGLITVEDLIESIVGSIQDEYDNEQEDCTELSPGVFIISGTADPETIEKFGLSLPADHGYDTMSGFFIDQLGRIPEENEAPTILWQDVQFTALIIGEQRVERLKAVLVPIPSKNPNDSVDAANSGSVANSQNMHLDNA